LEHAAHAEARIAAGHDRHAGAGERRASGRQEADHLIDKLDGHEFRLPPIHEQGPMLYESQCLDCLGHAVATLHY
jgi:hypothetical protein